MKKENKSFLIHTVFGIAIGVLSLFLNNQTLALLMMLAVAAVLVKALDKFLGKEKLQWWFSNGLWIYFMMWMISWIVLYNVWVF